MIGNSYKKIFSEEKKHEMKERSQNKAINDANPGSISYFLLKSRELTFHIQVFALFPWTVAKPSSTEELLKLRIILLLKS